MRCTNFDFSGDEVGECGNEDFDVVVKAWLSLDASGGPEDSTLDLDGLSHEEPHVACKKCHQPVEVTTEMSKAIVIGLLKLEKRLDVSLVPFSSYVFEDGTAITPESISA